jgi:hypothetical protein
MIADGVRCSTALPPTTLMRIRKKMRSLGKLPRWVRPALWLLVLVLLYLVLTIGVRWDGAKMLFEADDRFWSLEVNQTRTRFTTVSNWQYGTLAARGPARRFFPHALNTDKPAEDMREVEFFPILTTVLKIPGIKVERGSARARIFGYLRASYRPPQELTLYSLGESPVGNYFCFRIEHWLSLLLLLVITPGSWFIARRLRRARATHRMNADLCASCGYSLHRNTSGRCPECGTPARADYDK